jgi:hypothetical protein
VQVIGDLGDTLTSTDDGNAAWLRGQLGHPVQQLAAVPDTLAGSAPGGRCGVSPVASTALWPRWRCGPAGVVAPLALRPRWRCGPAGAPAYRPRRAPLPRRAGRCRPRRAPSGSPRPRRRSRPGRRTGRAPTPGSLHRAKTSQPSELRRVLGHTPQSVDRPNRVPQRGPSPLRQVTAHTLSHRPRCAGRVTSNSGPPGGNAENTAQKYVHPRCRMTASTSPSANR